MLIFVFVFLNHQESYTDFDQNDSGNRFARKRTNASSSPRTSYASFGAGQESDSLVYFIDQNQLIDYKNNPDEPEHHPNLFEYRKQQKLFDHSAVSRNKRNHTNSTTDRL